MIEINSVSISLCMLALAIIGIYVRITNEQTNHLARIVELEAKVSVVFDKLDDHETQIQKALIEIKESVHRVELSMAKISKDEHQ